jgi:hypothetical protein
MIVEASITINASKAAVWAATTDIARFAELLTGVERIEIMETPATGLVGLKWKETRMLFGKEATVAKWITAVEENKQYTTRAEQDGFVFITVNGIAGDDGCVMLVGLHVTMAKTFAAQLKALPMIFFKGVIKKAIMQDLTDIKVAVEREQRAMHVDLALFDGDTLLDRGAIRIGPSEAVDSFSHFRVTHRLGADAADVVLSDFSSQIGLVKSTLDLPIHESADWESIVLDRYTLAFRCKLDA